MKRILFSFFMIIILSACSQGEDLDSTLEEDDDILNIEEVEVPSDIFVSEKQNEEIDEEEMKVSIQIYLDSHEELDQANYPFLEAMDEEKELNDDELETLAELIELIQENDENFSNYISNNTLPDGYQEESERISQYITAYNTLLSELDDMLNELMDDASKGKFTGMDIEPVMSDLEVVNGREQNKIEAFLEEKGIKTKAFGLGDEE